MAWTAPCKYCERQGCGSYHDQCPEYQAYIKKRDPKRLEHIRTLDNVHDVRRNWKFESKEHKGLQRKDYTRRNNNG